MVSRITANTMIKGKKGENTNYGRQQNACQKLKIKMQEPIKNR